MKKSQKTKLKSSREVPAKTADGGDGPVSGGRGCVLLALDQRMGHGREAGFGAYVGRGGGLHPEVRHG